MSRCCTTREFSLLGFVGKREEGGASYVSMGANSLSHVRNDEAIKKSEGLAQTHGISSAAYMVDGTLMGELSPSLSTWLVSWTWELTTGGSVQRRGGAKDGSSCR